MEGFKGYTTDQLKLLRDQKKAKIIGSAISAPASAYVAKKGIDLLADDTGDIKNPLYKPTASDAVGTLVGATGIANTVWNVGKGLKNAADYKAINKELEDRALRRLRGNADAEDIKKLSSKSKNELISEADSFENII